MADNTNNPSLEEQVRTRICEMILQHLDYENKASFYSTAAVRELAEAYRSMFGEYKTPQKPGVPRVH